VTKRSDVVGAVQKKLPAIHANEGLGAELQKKLDFLLEEMNNSLLYWLSAAYKANKPEIASDASPAATLTAIMKKLAKRWNKKFSEAAPDIAKYFATAAKDRTDSALKAALKKAGVTIEFKTTKVINDIIQAAVAENVSSITTIATEHLADVEQMVMRSVMAGGDLGGLREGLQKRYGISKRKAKLIARQSNRNASAMVKRAREKELGVTEGIWVHSHAGKVPRPEHEAWHGKKYNIETGMWSKVAQKFVWPGTDFNCRCTGRSILPTFGRAAFKEEQDGKF
jgi:SPP1 gp7 family putative phage head morphogenesis protein